MIDKRRQIELLPGNLQNDQLKKFFSATVDHWFQPESSKKIAGFVGRIPSFFDPTTDFYQVEPTSERQFYQLEPLMLTRDSDNNIDLKLTYPDLIDQLRFQGANVDNHSRLFEQEYYSWSPPIDIDKFLNFTNYYWYPEGPTTISVDGDINNIINVDSDIIGQTSYTSPNAVIFTTGMSITFGDNVTSSTFDLTKTYIVEGVGTGIILIDTDELTPDTIPLEDGSQEKEYITIARGSGDKNPWSRNNHWYHRDVLTFTESGSGQSGTVITETPSLWDGDAEPWDTTPWDATITILVSSINLDSNRQARRPIVEFERGIELYNYGTNALRNVTLIDLTTTDVFSDIQGQAVGTVTVDGQTLANGNTILVTADTNNLVNNRVYLVNELEVSPGEFEYQLTIQTDGADSSGNPVAGEKVTVLEGTNQGKEYYFDGTNYVIGQRRLSTNQFPLFKLYDNEGNELDDESVYNDSTFTGSTVFNYQRSSNSSIIDSELGFAVNYKNFTQISEIIFEHTLVTESFNYEVSSLVRETIPGYYYFHILPSTGISEKYGNGWNKAPVSSSQSLDGNFYEIPNNLQANPDYLEPDEVTRSELLNHFASIITNQEGITGTGFTDTNYRDTIKNVGLGIQILQHQAPLLKTMMLASTESLDYILSVRYVQREYRRFFNKFVKRIEGFIKQGLDPNTIPFSKWLEDAFELINASKIDSSMFPFSRTRILPHDQNFSKNTFTATSGDTTFSIPSTFNPDDLDSNDMVLVYVDNELKLINYDYNIVGSNVVLTSSLTGGESVEVRYYSDIAGAFIPATAAVLGLTPVYKPEKFVDTTYSTPRIVIQGHDGTIHIAYNDERDDVILEFEKRIYNTIRSKFKGDREIFLDIHSFIPGKFRDVGYTQSEFAEVLTPIFTTWATNAGIRWNENTTVDNSDFKTWNWSGLLDTIDSEEVFGSWRAIYRYYYDTDRPNTHPWEMLGFSEQPTWWESTYGSAPYTSSNTALWTDLQNGTIQQGTRAGTNSLFARPGLLNIIPVNSSGDLLSPTDIGIVNSDPSITQKSGDWAVGDWSPAENAFFRSVEGSFVISQLGYLLKPAQWIEFGWDTEGIEFSTISPDQLINRRFLERPMSSNLNVAGETINDVVIRRAGIQQWISNFLEKENKNIGTNFGNSIRGLNTSLGWKAAGFLNSDNLRFQADSFTPGSTATSQKVFIQDDDIEIELYNSPSVKESFYGGVLIEWTGTGYTVFGYDVLNPFFTIIPAEENGRTITITVGNVTVTEDRQFQIGVVQEVPYGFEFSTRQDLYNFLISYEKYLESQGWVFDEYDNNINEILNWRFSGKEFLFWSQDDLEPGSFITLSPFAEKAKFTQVNGLINNIEEFIQGTYSILDRAGQAINPRDLTTIRGEDTLEVFPTNEQGLYAVRLSVSEYEHIAILRNITRFNDTIYLPLFNLRQSRLKAFGFLTDDWNGRIDAPGFILDLETAGDLVPNFEKTVADVRRYHDIENPSENDVITDTARHLIGYQQREYLDNLLIDRDTQYQFYQGFIHHKGTPNAFNRLFRSDAITTSTDVTFFEQWAIRVAEYGATEKRRPFEFTLLSNDVKTDPQIILFSQGNQADSPVDNVIEILPNDERWFVVPGADENRFELRESNTFFKKDLPNAGFVQFGETDYLAFDPSVLLDSTSTSFAAAAGETVWVAKDSDNRILQKDWDVLRLLQFSGFVWYSSGTDNNVIESYVRDNYVGDGVNTVFATSTTIPLNTDTLVVTIDGEETSAFSIINETDIVFTNVPAIGAVIVIDSLANHNWNLIDVIAIFESSVDNIRQSGIVESFSETSITINSNITFTELVQSGSLFYWESRRYANSNASLADVLLDPSEFTNQLVFFDQDEQQNGWVVYRSNGSTFREQRREQSLVNINLVEDALVFDDDINRITAETTLYDPFKGIIPGIADAEITYKLEYDPARYTNGPSGESFNDDLAWGINQLGQVWWDLTQIRYAWYEQGNLEYRYQNWGSFFPGSSIDVYEWVRSPVLPTDWADFVSERESELDFSVGGTVKDIDTDEGPRWVQKQERDRTTNSIQTFYYFWVVNKTTVPNLRFRSIPISEITSILTNPLTNGVRWSAPIREDAFIVANVQDQLNDESTALQINFRLNENDPLIHSQWELISEGDSFSRIRDRHWNKMRDSLVGFDDLGKEVPDNNLRGKARLGHFIRPRQTWFEDKLKARRIFIEKLNGILAKVDVVGTISNFDTNLNTEAVLSVTSTVITGTVANPVIPTGSQLSINGETVVFSGLNGIQGIADEINIALANTNIRADIFYNGDDAFVRLKDEVLGQDINLIDVVGTPTSNLGWPAGITVGQGPKFVVSSRAERDSLTGVAIGEKVYVTNDENFNSYWSLWQFLGNGNWELLQVQSFKTNVYWEFIDWYEEGFSVSTPINLTVATLTDRNDLTPSDGEVVKVENDGSNKFAIYKYDLANQQWDTIGKEDATIQFLDTLYDVEKAGFGFDDSLFDIKPFDDVPNVEFREIMNAVRNQLLVDSLEIEQNNIFFSMINYVHTEQEILDWIFKTSLLFIVGFTEDLNQRPVFTNDGFESLIDYINEAKPYRTKIKDIIRTFATVTDEQEVNVIDYDKPPFAEADGTTRILDVENTDDAFILQNNEPWSFWFDEYLVDNRPTTQRPNNVRSIRTRLLFDRKSAIRQDFIPSIDFSDNKELTTAIDSTSSGNNGAISNLTFVEGLLGNSALQWPGDSTTSSVVLPTTALNGFIDLTIEVLFQIDSNIETSRQPTILSAAQASQNDEFFIIIDEENTGLGDYSQILVAVKGTTLIWNSSDGIPVLTDGNSRRLSVTRNGVSGVVELFVDGESFGTRVGLPGALIVEGLYVGQEQDSVAGGFESTQSFDGVLDDLRFWNEIRSSTEIQQNANIELTGLEDNLTGYWKFDEGLIDPYPFFTSTTIDSTSTRDNPSWVLFDNVSETPNTESPAYIRYKPINDIVTIDVIGDLSSGTTIDIVASDTPDFSGTNTTLVTISQAGTTNLSFISQIFRKNPFLRVETTVVADDAFIVTASVFYTNSLTRVLDDYSPVTGQPQLLEILESEYLGTIIDGFNIQFSEGWDATPWDFVGWDSEEVTLDGFLDTDLSGGAFTTYSGDNTTGTYNLPVDGIGTTPWKVYISDTSLDPLIPLLMEETVHYTINTVNNTITLLTNAAFTWMNGSNLDTGWALAILDSTFDSNDAFQLLVDGNTFLQPHDEGWPEELVPLVLNESILTTVVTSGNLQFNLLSNVRSVTDGEAVTFGGETPIIFTFSGISGDTVVLEGSNTGNFTGEETTITTVTADGSINVPDQGSGFSAFTFYRARVTVYGSGNITVVGQLNFAPEMKTESFSYDSVNVGTGPYGIDNDIQSSDDLLVTVNGVLNTDYTVNVIDNTITFTVAQTNGDFVQVNSWNTSGIADTDPTFATAVYSGSALDLTNFGVGAIDVKPGPTQPLESSMMVFADVAASGFRRLAPPEANYHVADGFQNEFVILPDQFNITPANITVWVDNVEQTGSGTDFTQIVGGLTSPSAAIASGGTGYVVGDVLTVSGGTGTAVQVTVLEVSSGVISNVSVSDPGLYTVTPTNPVSHTGGTGTGATFNLTSYSTISDKIRFEDNGTNFGVVGLVSGIINAGSGYTLNDILTVSGGSAVTPATLRVNGVSSGSITSVVVENQGQYSTMPGNPVSVTGGTGSGAQVNLNFVFAPEADSTVSMKILGNEEYEITGDNIDFPGFLSATIGIMSFKNDDSPSGIQTVSLPGNPVEDDVGSPEYIYPIRNTPVGKDYLFVTIDETGGTTGGGELAETEYEVSDGGWDTTPWDGGSDSWDNNFGATVKLISSQPITSRVVITSLSGQSNFSTLTYRELRGWDTGPEDRFVEFTRFSDAFSTTITITNVQPSDNVINVADASIFPLVNGVVWVNGERIQYLSRTGGLTPGASGTLVGLIRGSKGTRKNRIHGVGSVIRAADESQVIPDIEDLSLNDPGLRLQVSNTVAARFIQQQAGGYKNFS